MDNIEADRELVREALHEAIKRYPEAERGLTFFYVASGLGMIPPTNEAVKWAREVLQRRQNKAQ